MPLQLLHYDDWGSDKTYPHMAVPWAWAFDTPFKWTKQVASHFGGTRQGLAISWPGHIKDVGGIRTQFHHVIDIVPTILEAAGIQAPDMVNGIKQKPIEGVSMVYTFDQANANAPSKRDTQYFEMVGNRAIYNNGWIAATTPPSPPWLMGTGKMPDIINGYKWELYNITEDYSEYNDLAAKNPDKLHELQALFLKEAAKYQVFPLDNSGFVRLLAPKPSAVAGRTEFTYTGENPGIPVGNAPSILDRDYTITANITVPDGGAEGVIATMGGRFGGYALLLSHSFNWWLKSSLFKAIGLGLLVAGIASCLAGQERKVEKTLRLRLLANRRAWTGCRVCHRRVWNRQRQTGIRLQLPGLWSASDGKGSLGSVQASTPSCLTSNTTAPAPPKAALACCR